MCSFKKIFMGFFCSILIISSAVPVFASDKGISCTLVNTKNAGQSISVSDLQLPDTLTSFKAQLISLRSSSGRVTLDNGKSMTWAKAIRSGYIEVDDFNLSGVMVLTEVSKNVKVITVSDDITRIDSNAFYGCSKLTSVNFSKSSKLGIVGKYAFAYCTKLKSITFPQNVKVIRGKAFLFCANLKQITISSSTFINNSSIPTNAVVYYY